MDDRLWRQNIDDDPNHETGGVLVAESVGRPVGFAVARICRVPMGADGLKQGQGWLNALAVLPDLQRQGVASRLLQRAEAWLSSKGARQVRLGGDPGHFFPALPVSSTAARAFFQARGYQVVGEPCYDLIQDIRSFQRPAWVDRIMATRVDFRVTRCTNRNVPALLEFVQRSFPGRWLYETQVRLGSERSPQDIVVMVLGNRVVGFVHTYRSGSARLGPSVYWRGLLGSRWGGLGPMGVAPDIRGQGLGFALLCDVVELLRRDGVENMTVDWTGLLDFYGRAGFSKWKEYVPHGRDL